MRYAFWKQAGDLMETQLAQERLAQLNVQYDGKAVFEPATMIIISITVVATAAICTWIVVKKPNGEDLVKVVKATILILAEAVPVAALAA